MARNYKEEYQHWLDSPALSEEEWAELNASPATRRRLKTASLPRWSSALPVSEAP